MTLSAALAAAACATGLIAAYFWYLSSRIKIIRPDVLEMSAETMEDVRSWQARINEALNANGKLNAKAAIWTAISVVLGAASAIAGTL